MDSPALTSWCWSFRRVEKSAHVRASSINMPKSRHMHGLTCTHHVLEFSTCRRICGCQSIIHKHNTHQRHLYTLTCTTSYWSFGRVEKSAHVRASSINMPKSRHMHGLTCTHHVLEFSTCRRICGCQSIIHKHNTHQRHLYTLTCTTSYWSFGRVEKSAHVRAQSMHRTTLQSTCIDSPALTLC